MMRKSRFRSPAVSQTSSGWEDHWSDHHDDDIALDEKGDRKSILHPSVNPYDLNKPTTADLVDVDTSPKVEDDEIEEVEASNGPALNDTEGVNGCGEEEDDNSFGIGKDNRFLQNSKSHIFKPKFPKRTFQIVDDVIPEEDEDDLLLEETSVTRSTVVVKSILKPQSTTGQQEQSVKKEVTFDEMGTVSSVPSIAHSASEGQCQKCESQPSSTTDDDSDNEWSGYDKVIVGHNLAEEILDEIYGKFDKTFQAPDGRNRDEQQLTTDPLEATKNNNDKLKNEEVSSAQEQAKQVGISDEKSRKKVSFSTSQDDSAVTGRLIRFPQNTIQG